MQSFHLSLNAPWIVKLRFKNHHTVEEKQFLDDLCLAANYLEKNKKIKFSPEEVNALITSPKKELTYVRILADKSKSKA